MAIDPSIALTALKNLQAQRQPGMPMAGMPQPPDRSWGQSGIDDPNTQLLTLQKQHLDDVTKNLENRGDGFYTAATPSDATSLQSDIAENPVKKQQDFLDAMQKANEAAQMQGFGVGGEAQQPAQQQAEAGRQAELAKMFMPLQTEQLRGQNELAKQQMVGEQAQALARQQAEAQQQNLATYGGGAGAGGGVGGLKPTIGPKGITWSSITTPASVQQQARSAGVGTQGIDALSSLVDTMDQKGWIGPVAGSSANYMTSGGVVPGLLGQVFMSPEQRQTFDMFKSQVQLVKSNLVATLGSARAASSPGLLARFDQLVNPTQDKATIKGGLIAFRNWLSAYASAPDESAKDQLIAAGVDPFLGNR